jgi:Family of unknown function (DUF6328)
VRIAPMSLAAKIKTGLNELRMLVLGCQVIVGFQFQAGFQNGFDLLPQEAQVALAVALLLTLVSLALLVAPDMRHALIDGLRATRRAERDITVYAGAALLPFAAATGLDAAVAGWRVADRSLAIAAGAGVAAAALFFWYVRALLDRGRHGQTQRAKAAARKDEVTPLPQQIEYMLIEARTILPGVQAMLGFQLIVVLATGFDELPDYARWLHLAALGLVALSIVLLMAPAAYHRIVYRGEDSERFLRLGSCFVFSATIPLALGLAADSTVAIERMLHDTALALACGTAVLLGLVAVWHVVPIWLRLQQRSRARDVAWR